MTNKRQRELARAKYERQSERRALRAKRSRVIRFGSYGLAVLAIATYFIVKPGSDSGVPVAAPTSSAPTSTAPGEQPVKDCATPAPTRADNISFQKPGAAKVGAGLLLTTNCGVIGFSFNPETPKTAEVLTFLTESRYFDGTKCHRLTTQGIFVLQCGDPAGNGTGGPGFKFDDESLPTADSTGSYVYARGTVAMANSGPNTNGSQFFLVYEDSPLPPSYTVVGTITEGLEVLDAISSVGVSDGSSDGSPTQTVVIERATTI